MDNAGSILTSVKKLLGIAEEYTQFDTDIIIHINTIFMALQQMGIGPKDGFSITDENDIWTDFMADSILLNSVKTYMYLRVKLLFDPPLTSSTVDSFNKLISELEFRMNSKVEYPNNQEGENYVQT